MNWFGGWFRVQRFSVQGSKVQRFRVQGSGVQRFRVQGFRGSGFASNLYHQFASPEGKMHENRTV